MTDGASRGKGRPPRTSGSDALIRSRADELHASGMPFQLALAVARGKTDLSSALEQMAKRDRIDRIMQDHALSRSLAAQVVLGQVELERVLHRRRLDAFRKEHRDRTALEAGVRLCIAFVDGTIETGVIEEEEPYRLQWLADGTDAPSPRHKLEVALSTSPTHKRELIRAIRVDKKIAREGYVPAKRPQDRYPCSDQRLFHAVERASQVDVVLVGGQQLRGQIEWFARFEFGLRIKSGLEVNVFRHALHKLGDRSLRSAG